jgi:CHAT domain-containing protein
LGTIAQRQGAKAVIGTLGSVNDPATANLMQTMYRLRQQNAAVTKDEALRQAQLRLLSGDAVAAKTDANRGVTLVDAPSTSNGTTNWSHPYYWAPFILIGNWK